MVILQNSPDSIKSKMKSYLKRVVYRPGGKKIDRSKRKNSTKCGYLGDDERAQLTRTFSPPAPRSRPFPLIISHQSEETLHHINNSDSCDIGSAGSSHSSGFNESMLETLENPLSGSGFRPFDVDSPIVSEYNYQMRDDDTLKKSTSNCVFEGFGGTDIGDTMDFKDQNQLIKSLTHKNKVLTQERRELEAQLEHQEDILDKMELEMTRIKREKRDIEKSKKEEGGRMRLENKELEYSLEKLREQRLDAENKLELMERERDTNKIQLEEVRMQLQQAIDEHIIQKEKNNELIRQLENKERQLSSLADDYKQDSDINMATQYKLEELNRENDEMRRHVQHLKNDKELLAGNLSKVVCELSRLKQGVPLSPTSSTNSSITSPIVNYHSLLPVFEEGDTLDDLLNDKTTNTTELLDEIEHSGYINISEIMEERTKLIQRNEMLEQELQDMRKLMYVVAPQHYIDDEALQFNSTHVQYTKPVEIQYQCFSADSLQDVMSSQLRITPSIESEEDSSPNTSTTTLAGIPEIPEHHIRDIPGIPEGYILGHSTPDIPEEEEEELLGLEVEVERGGVEQHSTPYPLHSTPSSLHSVPSSLHSVPSSLHSVPSSLHSVPSLHSAPYPLHSAPSSLHSVPSSLHSVPSSLHSVPSSLHSAPSSLHSGSDSRDPSDDADSGVLCQSSTDLGEHNCENCTLWHPEKEMLISKVVKTELDLEQVKCERDRYEYELNQLQPARWRGWLVHLTALVILIAFLFTCFPLIFHHQCKHNNHVSWADFLSYKVVHLRDRNYHIPH